MTPQLLISFQFLYNQPTTFWAMPFPRENTPDWVIMSEFVLEKSPTLGSKIGPFVWSLVYPKWSKLEVYNPWVMILENKSIICKSNDPQIFHLQNKLWLYKLFMRLGACFGTIKWVHPSCFWGSRAYFCHPNIVGDIVRGRPSSRSRSKLNRRENKMAAGIWRNSRAPKSDVSS